MVELTRSNRFVDVDWAVGGVALRVGQRLPLHIECSEALCRLADDRQLGRRPRAEQLQRAIDRFSQDRRFLGINQLGESEALARG